MFRGLLSYWDLGIKGEIGGDYYCGKNSYIFYKTSWKHVWQDRLYHKM